MKIDWLKNSQHNAFVILLCELQQFYNPRADTDATLVKKHLQDRLLSDSAATKFLIASNEDEDVIGFAAIGLNYSLTDARPDHSHRCVVEELYIAEAHRETGVGLKLITKAARWALDLGCSSMDWDVRSENVQGRRFYERLGGRIVEDRVSYRISERNMLAITQM